MTTERVREAGLAALSQALSPADMVRFLQLYAGGSGDYTAERQQTMEDGPIGELVEEITLGRGR